MRDHAPVIIEEFKGLWRRGDPEDCPLDHFTDCQNVILPPGKVQSRNMVGPYQDELTRLGPVIRIYNYQKQDSDSLLVLTEDGSIYHITSPTNTYGPILTIPEMTDFAFVAIAGRAYISPFNSILDADGLFDQIGLEDEFLYVYKGDGTAARKAAGPPPISNTALVSTPGVAGFSDLGLHLFAVVYETDTGYLTALGPLTTPALEPNFAQATSVSEVQGYTLTDIPISPDSYVTKRHIVATKAIDPAVFNGDLDGYQFFFVPDGNIDDNVTTSKAISFYDIDLIEDASHLIDNFTEIPAGVFLTTYNGRLVMGGEFDNISLVRLSAPGEPEAIDQVDGLVIFPLDGKPVTNAQQFREILYMYKQTRTFAVIDNQDIPSSWIPTPIDNGVGCEVHGIAQILDSSGVNADYLIIISYTGILLFNGTYIRPELTFKISDFWLGMERRLFQRIQVANDTINQIAYINLPDGSVLYCNYSEAISPKDIKFSHWIFKYKIVTLTFTLVNQLIMGSNEELYP